ncbi:hypothetical protein [Maribellus sp. YY47]|uniref:hypothetical protein n=1 Tax=Maribellus sp. YY47 TaxID=2929486 RepID=UPI0020014C62|nr:hypothetical protein [Maribellus sp. YY47]MCK3684236.1 hypothetical protein [Maribellus sp. YY47]
MKKKIPLIVLETLEKYVKLKGEQFEVISPDKFLIKVVDKDTDSDFYFNIEDYKMENGLKLLIDWKPANKESISNSRAWRDGKQLDGFFSNWVSLLKRYETVNSFFDDPILESFAEEYYAEFEIIDEDAETKPLNSKQILMLDEHLEFIKKNIENFKTKNNEEQLNEIKQDIETLREKLTSKSKKWVIKNLSIIWAKITKQGTSFMKEFLNEAKKTAIKEGLKLMIELGSNMIN